MLNVVDLTRNMSPTRRLFVFDCFSSFYGPTRRLRRPIYELFEPGSEVASSWRSEIQAKKGFHHIVIYFSRFSLSLRIKSRMELAPNFVSRSIANLACFYPYNWMPSSFSSHTDGEIWTEYKSTPSIRSESSMIYGVKSKFQSTCGPKQNRKKKHTQK